MDAEEVSQEFVPLPSSEAVHALMTRLSSYGVRVWLFGGWAEELLGLGASRPHKDLDLLYPAEGFDLVDAFMNSKDVQEISAKHSVCSRGFVTDRHFVEFYLVRADAQGWYTDFWGYVHRWPADTFSDKSALPKASEASLAGLRGSFAEVERAFNAHAHQSKQRAR